MAGTSPAMTRGISFKNLQSLAMLAAFSSRLSLSRGFLQRRPGEFRIILQHHPVVIGGEVREPFGPLPQRRLEERRQNSGERAERGGVDAAGRIAHQVRLVAKLH